MKHGITCHLNTLLCLVLCGVMLLSSSCAMRIQAEELSAGYTRNTQEAGQIDQKMETAMSDFAFDLFHETLAEAKPGENQNISPLSAMLCLSLIANGAEGETLAQMEAALGMPMSELNPRLYAYAQRIAENNGDDCRVSLGNSVWFRDDQRLTVKPAYLQTVANWYDAEIFAAPFDAQTVKDINNWCKKETDGMIDEILKENDIDGDSVLFLINALYFDAKWAEEYEKSQVSDGTFTNQDGTKANVTMLSSTESVYLSGEGFTGFTKDYKGGQYSFAALLPDEGTDIDTFAASLTGETWRTLWGSREKSTSVAVRMPEFTFDYSLELTNALKAMGMTDMFDSDLAAFAPMATSTAGNIYCSCVKQKTCIQLDRNGTKAAAITWGEMKNESAPYFPYSVCLDRPFVFAIVDNQSGLPLFLGVIRTL